MCFLEYRSILGRILCCFCKYTDIPNDIFMAFIKAYNILIKTNIILHVYPSVELLTHNLTYDC